MKQQREISEERLQSECFVWFWNTFPALRGLLSYNLNNSKNRIDGSRNRALGLTKGRSDMEFNYNKKTYFIEFKTPTGRQSTAQKKWQKTVESQGFEYYLVRSFDEFKKLITKILSNANNNRDRRTI